MKSAALSLIRVVVLLGAMLVWGAVPSMAAANQDALVPPCSVASSFTASPIGDPPYDWEQTVRLKRGQTITVSLVASDGVRITKCSATVVGSPYYLILDPNARSFAFTVSGDASQTCYLYAAASAPGTFTLDLALAGPVRFGLYAMKAPTRARARRRFTVSARLSDYNGFHSPMRFQVERYRRGKWKAYGTKPGVEYYGTPSWRYTASLRLPRGKFRIRARFRDAAHPYATYNKWKTITVK